MSRKSLWSLPRWGFVRSFSSLCRVLEEARPPTAPKQTPDIAHIRQNVELYQQNVILRKYGQHADAPHQIAANAQKAADLDAALKKPRVQIKALQAQLSLKSTSKEKNLLELRRLKPLMEKLVQEQGRFDAENKSLALALPNLTSTETPTDEREKVLSYINFDPDRRQLYDKTADHSLIGDKLSLIDFASASSVSGWGFYYLLNDAALLEQALVQYALSVARQQGWKIVTPPSLVYGHIAESCGFQPRDQNDEQQIWQVAQSTKEEGKPKRSLAATAEIPLAGLYAGKDIRQQDLPIKVVGSSRCYRAEAGARGVDTKGLYRVHEFTKVEMFAWADHNQSNHVFDDMVDIQTKILTSLGLPCRVLEMPSSDLGASAYRKIDIEALFPSRISRDEGWGEVTSVSMCTDYQSRRLDTRILEQGGSRKLFAHTLNGTAMAVPRVLAAILEHGWNAEEQSVVVPEVLRSYMGGKEKITKEDR